MTTLVKTATEICSKCEEEKDLDCFSKSKRHSQGRQAWGKDCARSARSDWVDRNPERANQLRSESQQRNREAANLRYQRWRECHPGREYNLKRHRRLAVSCPEAEIVDRNVVFVRDEGECGICHGQVDPENFHIDHIIPLSKGGSHIYSNVQLAHPRCNLIKGNRLGIS